MSHDTDAQPADHAPIGKTTDPIAPIQLDASVCIRTPIAQAPSTTGVWPSFMRRYTSPDLNMPHRVL